MIDLDFTPPNYHEARCLRSAIRLRASLVGAMMMLMFLWVVSNRNEVATAKAMLQEVRQQEEQVVIHQARRVQMQEEEARLRAHESLLHHLDDRTVLSVVFSEVSRYMSERVILTEVTVGCPSVAAYAKPHTASDLQRGHANPMESNGDAGIAAVVSSANTARAPHLQPGHIVLIGMATDTPEVISFVKMLEDSPLIAQVHLEQKGSVVWSGRRGQGFEITCVLFDQRVPRGPLARAPEGTH